MDWKALEASVRQTATYIWDCPAQKEIIAGVECDCVLRKENDYWIIIEITKQNNLGKVRDDLTKLDTMRKSLSLQQIFAKPYMILSKIPTNAMREAGKALRIKVLSYQEFQNSWFDYPSYYHCRLEGQFGSLVNIETGAPETNSYIDVAYKSNTGSMYHLQEIIEELKKGRIVVLQGDFGSGKSRCVKAIFEAMCPNEKNCNYTIAINLREHWGAKDSKEILRRHFGNLGMTDNYTQNFIKACKNPNIIYLLDGFDEIGTQQWNLNEKGVRHSRQLAVAAIKDLIIQSSGGMLICGREFYFNSDSEMMESLGLSNKKDILLLRCSAEFSDAEIRDYIQSNCHKQIPDDFSFPAWFPKRPLVLQIMEHYIQNAFEQEGFFPDVFSFWRIFLNSICEREARIHSALNPHNIMQILILLAEMTRCKSNEVGPLTMQDLALAFEKAVGTRPTDETAIMLQRLPGIGRIDAESPDRQFLDSFILNGLRAENIIQIQQERQMDKLNFKWTNPLDMNGCTVLAGYIQQEDNLGKFLGLAVQAQNHINQVLASDIIASITFVSDCTELDCKNIHISDSWISALHLNDMRITNLSVSDSIIYYMDLTNAVFSDNVKFERCEIAMVNGIASENGFPEQFANCKVDKYQSVDVVARIKKVELSNTQKIFLAIIQKVFFQPGKGRKEEALFRGLGDISDKHHANKILNKLLELDIISIHTGDEGKIYKANRKFTSRMQKIRAQLTLSDDPIWAFVTSLH